MSSIERLSSLLVSNGDRNQTPGKLAPGDAITTATTATTRPVKLTL